MSAQVQLLLLVCLAMVGCNSSGPSHSLAEPVCVATNGESPDFLGSLGCPEDWTLLSGASMNAAHGLASTVKIVYKIQSDSLFYVNSTRFPLHIDFAVGVLNISRASAPQWNTIEYQEGPVRHYVLGNLTYYAGPGLWAFTLFPGDNLAAERLKMVFQKMASTVWFGENLAYLPANEACVQRAREAGIPTVSADEIFQGQSFQAMNPGIAYGTLVRAGHDTVATGTFTHRDIVVTDGIPNDLPVVAGIITSEFQTPLSHINVLSTNRGTPNMGLRNAWEDSTLHSWEGKLVRLEVTLNGYTLTPTTPEEAQKFWEENGPKVAPSIALDTLPGLVPLAELGLGQLARVGAKAANFGELAVLAKISAATWKVPEGGFAIPFAAYLHHMQSNGLDQILDSLLQDSLFRSNASFRRMALEDLQARITNAPVDTALLEQVRTSIRENGQFTRMRFRSSTNAEDLKEFNGAGLYSSFTGDLSDPAKPIENAMRQVWASLWNFRAFEEREYYRIDPHRVAMGILVHRGFPDEGVNGVVLTHNIYDPEYFGYVINMQIGETSVVDPPPGITTEQLIYYPFDSSMVGEPSIETITRSSLNQGRPIMSGEELVHLGNALSNIQWRFLSLFKIPPEEWKTFGMDVEFKLDGASRTLYLKQARPL
jgi:hypothetical protein